MDEKLISYCGLVCSECEAYIATKAKDDEMAARTAKAWTQEYGHDIKPADVWCDGCTLEGKKCAHCSECLIRTCAIEQDVENCAHCVDYPCKKLSRFFKLAPSAKKTLDSISARAS